MAADPGHGGAWKCYDCNMVFGNPALLQKHRSRFCVGGPLGDPDLLLLRKGLYDAETPPHREPPVYERARAGGRQPPGANPFHGAQRKVKAQPNRKPQARVTATVVESTPRYNPNNDPKVQMLAENHGRQMAFLQDKNKDLERQREEIRRRLEDLGRRPPEKDNSNEELLRELREQEERNQRLLEELRRQLMEARRPVNVVRTERHTHQQHQQQPPPPQIIQQIAPPAQESPRRNFVYPVYYGNSLVAEIIAVRQAYLQNGGNDPDILSQLAQMEAEARAIDEMMKNAQKQQPKGKKQVNINFSSMELENERLMRQLQLLQEQKMISTNRRKDNREDDLEREIQRMQRDHLRKMYDLQREMERLRQEQYIERMRIEMQMQQHPTRIILQHPGGAPAAPAPQIIQLPAPSPAPAPAPQIIQASPYPTQRSLPAPGPGPYVDLNVVDAAPYDQYSSPRRAQAYGHTWVHTHHRQDELQDPYYDLHL